MRSLTIAVGAVLYLGFAGSAPATLYAQIPGETITIGGRAGWEVLDSRDHIVLVEGWQGGTELALSDRTPRVDRDTDLYASFDRGIFDRTGTYEVRVQGARRVEGPTRFGQGAAAFNGESSLVFAPRPGAAFGAGGVLSSFTIDFWAHPLRVQDGATLFSWEAALVDDRMPMMQRIQLSIRDGRFVWSLENVVAQPRLDGGRDFRSVTLAARRGPIPGHWVHHQLEFNAETRRISYLVDGIVEAITYLTDTGREGGAPAFIERGSVTRGGLTVGESFHGFLDEFRISLSSESQPRTVAFAGQTGRAYTRPIQLNSSGAHVRMVNVRTVEPDATEARVWYRVGDMIVSRDPSQSLQSDWRRVPTDGTLPPNTRGRYIQLRFDLLPDASGSRSPRVKEVRVGFNRELPPQVPRMLEGTPAPGGVQLSWDGVSADDLAGYRVYIGTRPERYLGTENVASPMDVGETTTAMVQGLEPDRAYVFAVESYDRYGESSGLSREVQVRAGSAEG